ncbi:hypothetical protein A2125_01595, partial [Candidatus Woesebacteria bacterium GWB1_43_5]
MEFISTQRYIRVSPRKLREVAFMVKKLKPTDAIEMLPHSGKKAGLIILKAMKTSVANAVAKGADTDELTLKEIQVNE